MKIKTKLLIGLATLPVLFFLLIGVSWYRMINFNEMKTSLENTYQATFLAEQIHIKIRDEAIAFRNVILFTEDDAILQEIARIEAARESISKDIIHLESMLSSPEQKIAMANLRREIIEYYGFVDKGITHVGLGERDLAIQMVNEFGHQNREVMVQAMRELTNLLEGNMDSFLHEMPKDFEKMMLAGSIITLLGSFAIMLLLLRNTWTITFRLREMSTIMGNVAAGSADLNTRIASKKKDEIDHVADSFNLMTQSLSEQLTNQQNLNWVKSNTAEITKKLTETKDLESLSQKFLSNVAPLVEACHAVFYIRDTEYISDKILKSLVSYAYTDRLEINKTLRFGEGLVGQAALENVPILLTNVPADYISIKSAHGEVKPLHVYVLPVSFKDEVNAVIEIATFQQMSATQQALLDELIDNLGIVLESIMSRIQLAKLLQESQALMEELQVQSEELQSQQEELRATNEELEEQTAALRESEKKLQAQQEELEQTNAELIEKAESLEIQNKKFEASNREIAIAKQVLEEQAIALEQSSKYKSEFLANMSHELRTPLNSLLILSKLLADNFGGNLTQKQIDYAKTIYSSGSDLLILINDILDLAKIESGKMEVHLGEVLISDLADYVEKNFRAVANEKGLNFSVVLHDNVPASIYNDEQRLRQVLKNLLSNAIKFTLEGRVVLEIGSLEKGMGESVLSFAVVDTGIGVPEDKKYMIFEAFQQADGTTSRKFGGTGLGLSISKEIAKLLGGEIIVESIEGKGSRFIFNVGDYKESDQDQMIENEIIQDEVAASVETVDQGVQLEPKKQMYEGKSTIKKVLIVEDDLHQRNSLMELIGNTNVILSAVSTGAEALEQMKVNQYDFMILDLGLTDTTGFELMKSIKSNPMNEQLKVFIFTGRDLTSKEEIELRKYAHTIIIKDAHSPQRLLEELQLCLEVEESPNDEKQVEASNPKIRSELEGKNILLVDDDVRNVFALSSILEVHGVVVTYAENGLEALDILESRTDLDLVLMDIMMPVMDGYEAMHRLRKMERYTDLPVIALTAKAMKEDRDLCIAAGASDYIAKPVDPDQLISLIAVWLYQ